MAGKVLDLEEVITPDRMGTAIAEMWRLWNMGREGWKREVSTLRDYLFAVDTKTTENAENPWNNKTTLPKLTQIRDNLIANYMAALFPRKKFFSWEGRTEDDDDLTKRKTIEAYIMEVVRESRFKEVMMQLLLDYIDTGNCFATVEWIDEGGIDDKTDFEHFGYVGPAIRRINPYDICMNPIAPSFARSPKIVKTIVSLGEVKELLARESATEEERENAQAIFDYLKKFRQAAYDHGGGEVKELDEYYDKDGFTSYQHYLSSDSVELLTFVGDIYDHHEDKFLRNYKIIVADRHKVISQRPNPSTFGKAPVFHSGWRVRQDNLWAMGPLANLVGMQYRIDHLENLKADLYDLTAFPMVKIKGYVEDFEWEPFGRIYTGDDGDVEVMAPDASALQGNVEIDAHSNRMEELAGAPKEAMGFRTPGEKTAFEVQRQENAASRIFQAKIQQFEYQIVEPLLNALLEMARRKISKQTVRVLEDDLHISTFLTISQEDLVGLGTLKPVAAQNFAEKATMMQNLTQLGNSSIGQDPEVRQHFSSIRMAKMLEDLLEIDHWELVQEYVRIGEQAEAQRLIQSEAEQLEVESAEAAGGVDQDNFDPSLEEPVQGEEEITVG
jgi:hypothetical protein